MLPAILLTAAIAFSGAAVTYLFDRDEPLLWRFAAGNVIGWAIFGFSLLVVGTVAGLTGISAFASLAIALSSALLFMRDDSRSRLRHEWRLAKDKMQGATSARALRFLYYLFFLLLFWAFFEQAMYMSGGGIFTGGSQNLGDLSFHLGAIYSFSDGANFPPQNPSYAGATFSYPFIADLVTAGLMKFGIPLRDAMLVQNISWAFSLLIVFERFVLRFTSDHLAGKLAGPILFFSGGLGFAWFFADYWNFGRGFFDLLSKLPGDYTITNEFRWGNSLVVLFITQRSMLLGMPLTIVVLGHLWKVFTLTKFERSDSKEPGHREYFPTFLIGLIAGSLPLVHLHSLAVLFVVTAFLFFFRLDRIRDWLAFGLGVCVTALPQLVWSMQGGASDVSEFFGWNFGWDSGETNVVWFWLKNTGLLFPALIAGIYLLVTGRFVPETIGRKHKKKAHSEPPPQLEWRQLLEFYAPFLFLFVIGNIVKLAPWAWDNIKVLFYWFAASIPFVAIAVVWLWRRNSVMWKTAAAAAFVMLIFSGALDVWRAVSGQERVEVFDADAVLIAERIRGRTPARAMFLNAPTYNTAVALSGRQSVMRYTGHLFSHGIDYSEREADVQQIYAGGPTADALIQKYDVEYILVSPKEREAMQVNDNYLNKFQEIAVAGNYRVLRVGPQ